MDGERDDRAKTAIDPTYGQRSALPDIEDEGDETSIQALAYLKQVRSEASGIPHLLVAEGRPTNQEESDDIYAYYEDGAYTGTTFIEDDHSEDGASNQELCYEMIRSRFEKTRLALTRSGNPDVKTTSMALKQNANYAQYSHAFLFTSPDIKEVANLSQDSVIQCLARYESLLSKRNLLQGDLECRSLGAWGWALLAKCRVAGQMDSDDISVLRDVGKAAIRTMKKIQTQTHEEDHEEQEDMVSTTAIGDAVVSKMRDLVACAGLDTLITIIGEEFGQRDLLNAREEW